jgi:hypothetical protein
VWAGGVRSSLAVHEQVFEPLLSDEAGAGWPGGLLLQPQADLLVTVVVGPVGKVLRTRGAFEGSLTGVHPLVGLMRQKRDWIFMYILHSYNFKVKGPIQTARTFIFSRIFSMFLAHFMH